MRLALNMAKTAKDGDSRASIEETKYLMSKPLAEVRVEKMRAVELCRHKQEKAAIVKHLAMLCQKQTCRYLPCQYGTSKNLHTHWRRKGTCALQPARHREWNPELTPPPPGTPPTPIGNTSADQPSEMGTWLARYRYLHTVLA